MPPATRTGHQSRIQRIIFVLLLGWYALTSAQTIDLTAGGIDLGRHLKNGELCLSSTTPKGTFEKILHTNFYSYTQPGAPFVNHHWLADLLFSLVWKLGRFSGLNGFYISLGVLTFFIFFRLAQKSAGFAVAAAVAVLLMPILCVRPSLRPEIFTLLLSGVFLSVLWDATNKSLNLRRLLLLPVLEVLWVNLHIGFILGPLFVFVFLLSEPLTRPVRNAAALRQSSSHAGEPSEAEDKGTWSTSLYKDKVRRIKKWLLVLFLTLSATVVNPSGLAGALYPVTVWSNYGFRVAENLPITTLEGLGYEGEFALIKLTLLMLGLSLVVVAWRSPRFPSPLLGLAVITGSLAWFTLRNQTLLALFSLSIIPINISLSGYRHLRRPYKQAATAVLLLVVVAGLYHNAKNLAGRRETIGLGLKPEVSRAAEFFKDNNLEGPIFNNYNIGGYLIYYLFPDHGVFIDSRPEAYRAGFLHTSYILPVQDEQRWAKLLGVYEFNVIFFSRPMPREYDFLLRRAVDPMWAAVFANKAAIIFLKRTTRNQSIIERHEIPKERLLSDRPVR
jgi:hypothetical protein